jgi:Coenzyme PQQ synthesis protein D (PqqD)
VPREALVTPTLSLDARVTLVGDVLASDLAGEIVLLNLSDGVYYGLDAVGTHIWHLLAQPAAVRAIVDDIVAHFDVDASRCGPDVLAFLEDLQAHGLLAVVASGDA